MRSIILATKNENKVKEIRWLLSGLPIQIMSLLDLPEFPDIVENGLTIEENAMIKAGNVFQATGIPALADDSGLEVFALEGRPGVYSARYAGENVSYDDNNNKLLSELLNVPAKDRGAQFISVAAFVGPDVSHVVRGICQGMIIFSPRGVHGFGYDPIFVPDGYEQTFAELSLEVKNSISHRAKAFTMMAEFLMKYFKDSP